MIQLHIATRDQIRTCTSVREGETKLGETVQICDSLDDMATTAGSFVVFGICEDIGVQANYGKAGARKAWDIFLTSFVNVQENTFNRGKDIILLGHISVSPDIKDIAQQPVASLGTIVHRIDSKMAAVIQRIVECGKIPIIIGGVHNNAYGAIKGSASALKKPIDVLNFDAHTDLRSTDYRHSGNGFSYAFEQEKDAYLQRIDLLNIKQDLVLDRARRALRFLKKMDKVDIAEVNKPLFNFLNYTTFMLLKDEENASLFKEEVSNANLKKAELILNINN